MAKDAARSAMEFGDSTPPFLRPGNAFDVIVRRRGFSTQRTQREGGPQRFSLFLMASVTKGQTSNGVLMPA